MYKIENKYYKAKNKNLDWRLDSEKYNIFLKIKNILRNIYEVCLKNQVFFCKVITGYKNEN